MIQSNKGFKYNRLDRDDCALLMVDHQSGLISLVQDFQPNEFKNNVLALATLGAYFKLPTVLTTSFDDGPNGKIIPELPQKLSNAKLIARPGQINAWDNQEFREAVRATCKKQLIIAGVVTDVCVAFPALSAIEEGYEVFVCVDASGTFNETIRNATHLRLLQAGAQLMSWFAIASELHRDWRRDIEGLGAILTEFVPNYRNLMNSYKAITEHTKKEAESMGSKAESKPSIDKESMQQSMQQKEVNLSKERV